MLGLIAVAEFHEHVDCAIVHPYRGCGAVIGNPDLGAGDAAVLKRIQGSVDSLGLLESDHNWFWFPCLLQVFVVLHWFPLCWGSAYPSTNIF